jgi:transcription elongation GreA/GreB family factor
MSRAFVKESDDDLDLPDRPVSEHPNEVTAEGLRQIEAALAESRKALAQAQSAGDRSAIAQASRDQRYWSARRATAHVVQQASEQDVIRFGATVTIRRNDGREQTYRMVGEDEADPARGTISHISPLARALFGREVGDSIRIGPSEAEIIAFVN